MKLIVYIRNFIALIVIQFGCSAQSSITFNFESCKGCEGIFFSPIALYKDGELYDSLSSLKHGFLQPKTLSSRKNYVFRSLSEGEYEVVYEDIYGLKRSETIVVEKGGSATKSLCFDRLPEIEYQIPGIVDKLKHNGILFICGSEALGEFATVDYLFAVKKTSEGYEMGEVSNSFTIPEVYDFYEFSKMYDTMSFKKINNLDKAHIDEFLAEIIQFQPKKYFGNPVNSYWILTQEGITKTEMDMYYRPLSCLIQILGN